MFKCYTLEGDECDIKMILLFYIHPKFILRMYFLLNTFANCAIRKSEVFLCLKTELLLDDTIIKDSFLVYCFILVELFYK